jgi:spore maturation protein CgeB
MKSPMTNVTNLSEDERRHEGGAGSDHLRLVIFGSAAMASPEDGNSRFLRGVSSELLARGHEVTLHRSPRASFDLERTLDRVDVVIVHDGTAPELVKAIRLHHASNGDYTLLFYDTHQRAATAPPEHRRFNLASFDGVLAAGEVIRQTYLDRGWTGRAWTWHEAADAYTFAPHPGAVRNGDLVWVGSRHDLGASQELGTLVLEPARRLGLRGVIHGDHYPWRARLAIQRSGLRYGGPLAEHLVPVVWARHRFTVELPRLAHALPGIPPVRMFEALACGIPLICSPWDDTEELLTPGRDYIIAHDQREMEAAMRSLHGDRAHAAELANQGRKTVLGRHTCGHRVEELLAIVGLLRAVAPEDGLSTGLGRAGIHAVSRKLEVNSDDSHYGSAREVAAG